MLAEPIARPLDLDDDGVMEESVEQRRGDDRVAEDVAPFGEAAVGGEDHRTLFVSSALTSWKNRLPPPGMTGR